mgnify:CR=1 FL=1
MAGKIYRNSNILQTCQKAGIECVLYEPNPEWMRKMANTFAMPVEERVAPEIIL